MTRISPGGQGRILVGVTIDLLELHLIHEESPQISFQLQFQLHTLNIIINQPGLMTIMEATWAMLMIMTYCYDYLD